MVIPYLRGDSTLDAKAFASAEISIPWVVLGELCFGANRAVQPAEARAQVVAFLRVANVLYPDRTTSEQYGDLKAELARIGRPIPDNDLWIAAIARQHGLPLATRDAHFARVPGLETLGW